MHVRQKNAILDRYLASSRVVNDLTAKCNTPDSSKLMTPIAGKRHRLLFAEDGRRSVNEQEASTLRRRQQNRI